MTYMRIWIIWDFIQICLKERPNKRLFSYPGFSKRVMNACFLERFSFKNKHVYLSGKSGRSPETKVGGIPTGPSRETSLGAFKIELFLICQIERPLKWMVPWNPSDRPFWLDRYTTKNRSFRISTPSDF